MKLDDRIVAPEANLRPPGGLTMDMFNYANDADLYQAWADLLGDYGLRRPLAADERHPGRGAVYFGDGVIRGQETGIRGQAVS